MPETGALIGTPASISASVEPQTEPIDEEPFDSSVSETMRMVYGKSSAGGIIASRARCARAPWPMCARFGGLRHGALRDAVLGERLLTSDRGRTDGEGQLDAVDDLLEEEVALGRLQLLRVLLGIGERTQAALELLADRTFHRGEALLLEQHVHAGPHLDLA